MPERKPSRARQSRAKAQGIPASVWALAVLLAGGAAWATYVMAETPAPLGVPLPPVPELVTTVEGSSASFNGRQLPDYWLKLLAPQPDGLPPLIRTIDGARADFTMRAPFGFSQVVFSQDQFARNGINFTADINFDQPLTEFRCSLPTRGKMPLDEYVEHMIGQLRDNGAEVTLEPEVRDISGYRMRYFEYVMDDAVGRRHHFAYVGPYAEFALSLDFMTTPYYEQQGRAYQEKIFRTLVPGLYMYKAQRLEEGTPAPGDVPEEPGAAAGP